MIENMPFLASQPVMLSLLSLKVFAVCCVILYFKIFAVAGVQGYIRVKHRTYVRPDDAKFFGKTEPAKEEHPVVQLANNTFRNDLENIPIFLFLALTYILLNCWETGSIIYFSIFTLSRVLHTIFYLKPRQPHRNLSYVTGQLVCMIIAVHILIKVISL